MARNTGNGHRIGAVRNRSQTSGPGGWTKTNTKTGRRLGTKSAPYKGVRKAK